MSAITEFLDCNSFAVAGASSDRSKYGNIVFRALRDSGRNTTPIHPTAALIEGAPAFPTLAEVPLCPEALSIVTRPEVTRQIVEQAVQLGIRYVWMQPGAEDALASQRARDAGLTVVDDGSCVLVALARKGSRVDRNPS